MDANLDFALRVIQICIQAAVPIIVFVLGRKIYQAQFIKSSLDAWNEFNKAVLGSGEVAELAYKKYGTGLASSSSEYRQKHLAFMALNALAIAHYGKIHGLVPAEMFDESLHLLELWLSQDGVYQLSQQRGYPRRFVSLCQKVHDGSYGNHPDDASGPWCTSAQLARCVMAWSLSLLFGIAISDSVFGVRFAIEVLGCTQVSVVWTLGIVALCVLAMSGSFVAYERADELRAYIKLLRRGPWIGFVAVAALCCVLPFCLRCVGL